MKRSKDETVDYRGRPWKPQPKRAGRDLRTARHEAAHAVIGTALGGRVLRAEILHRGTGNVYWDKRVRNTKFRWAIVDAAGTVVEHQEYRVNRNLWSSGDFKLIRKAGFDGKNLIPLRDLAGLYVRRFRRAIERVARALLRRDLTGAEIRKLLYPRRAV